MIPEAKGLIDKLQNDHVNGARAALALRDALQTYQQTRTSGFADFDPAAGVYIESSWKHLGTEEKELLPMARQRLAPQDWAGIGAAFEANKDPWSVPGELQNLRYSRPGARVWFSAISVSSALRSIGRVIR